MIKETVRNGLPLLEFGSLKNIDFIDHCFTTRKGGVSEGYFSSLNLSFTRGDDEEAVMENYRRVSAAVNVPLHHFVLSDQTHTVNVRKITEEDAGKGITKERDYTDVDGMVTNVPGIMLCTFFADCVPLYFVDPVHRAIGLSHSGWRGTVGRMGLYTIRKMQECYGTDPKDLYAAIGPSICRDCYEVSGDVAEEFRKEFPDHKEELILAGREGHFQLDLWEANRIVLLEAGVPSERIELAGLCTCCHPDLLFSHRASKGKRGNLGAFMFIREI
ncbi:MAG: peptidoglycan editing factor PgeF [Lachnospiraceae bacterium]|nr:peptidoglycan editing factor PgeF [Lachnospiraceae bacterium]